MRIISKFHDYYDCVQSHGQDSGLKYVRKEEEENLKNIWPFPSVHSFNSPPTWIKQNIIGFCGKIYPCLHLAYRHSCREHSTCRTEEYPTVFCFSMADVDAFVESNYKKKDIEIYRSNENRNFWK